MTEAVEPIATDGLMGRIELIESQPLDQRAQRFDQLADELLAELQRSDGVGHGPATRNGESTH